MQHICSLMGVKGHRSATADPLPSPHFADQETEAQTVKAACPGAHAV